MRVNAYVIKSTIVAALGGFLFGFDTAVISGVTQAITAAYHLSPASLGLTVASALIGTILGAACAGIPGDLYGRRDSLRITALLYFVSAVGCVLAWNWSSLMLFRFIGGLGIGGSSVLGPMYIAEIAPAKWRGRLVGVFQFNVIFGILLAYLSNYVVGRVLPGNDEWRVKLGVSAVPAVLFFLALFTIPRSPRWLVKKGRIAEAREILQMTGETDYEAQLQEIRLSIDAEHGHAAEALFSRKYRIPILLAVSIAIFNQLSGINAVLYYMNDIFGRAGFGRTSGDLQAVAVGATNLIFTVLAMSIIDRVGRKILLLIGSIGMGVSLAGVAVVFWMARYESLLVWLLAAYIAFFGFSQGTVIWVFISEIFPNRVRAGGQSLGSLTHWLMNAMISWIFPVAAAASHSAPFFFFSMAMFVQFFVVLFFFPETKGLSLEKLQTKLSIT